MLNFNSNAKYLIGLTFTTLFSSTFCYSQLKESNIYVDIPNTAVIIKTVKVKDCKDTISGPAIVKKEYTRTLGTVTYTISSLDSIGKEKTNVINYEKNVEVTMGNYGGKANISMDETDKSIYHVNYWLNPTNTIKAGTHIKIRNKIFSCDLSSITNVEELKLKADTSVDLWIVSKSSLDTTKDWFKYSNVIIEVFDRKDDTFSYYLVNRYDREGNYTIRLKNRETLPLIKKGNEWGPVTIPVKYRFKDSKNGKSYNEQFDGSINIGAYIGWKIIKSKINYQAYVPRNITEQTGSFGLFLNISAATLDSLTTNAGKEPFNKDKKATIGVFTPGIAFMYGFDKFRFGLYGGYDFGFGSSAKNWNYNARPWVGLGISYDILK